MTKIIRIKYSLHKFRFKKMYGLWNCNDIDVILSHTGCPNHASWIALWPETMWVSGFTLCLKRGWGNKLSLSPGWPSTTSAMVILSWRCLSRVTVENYSVSCPEVRHMQSTRGLNQAVWHILSLLLSTNSLSCAQPCAHWVYGPVVALQGQERGTK